MAHDHDSSTRRSIGTLFRVVVLISLAVGAYFLISEHRAHIFGGQWTAPILLIAFVGLHFLMHLGHGGHGVDGGHGGGCGGRRSSRDERQPSKQGESDNER